MDKKVCIKCKEEKDLKFFPPRKSAKDGTRNECKSCKREYELKLNESLKEQRALTKKKYYEANKEKTADYQKIYHQQNADRIRETRKNWKIKNANHIKKYNIDNADKILNTHKAYIKKRKQNDSVFALRLRIKSLTSVSFTKRGFSKNSTTQKILGCDYRFFKEYIEAQFTKEMSWENMSNWHLDHIYPISKAKTEAEVLALGHYTNFQPLLIPDNYEKGAKIISKQLRML